MSEIFSLWWGTVIHRPYVYGFLICYLCFGQYQQGWRKTGIYLVLAYFIALLSELCSTRYGFPFGIYTYIDDMRAKELWISNVPFWDSLSFVFLSYFSWMTAGAVRGSLRGWPSFLLAGIFMMLLDVVIDPLTLLGDRWFLGKIYFYPQGGTYFGVTLSNFAGWCFVGAFTPWIYEKLFGLSVRRVSPLFFYGIFSVYAGVFIFNLGITAWIGEWKLFCASLFVAFATLSFAVTQLSKKELIDVRV